MIREDEIREFQEIIGTFQPDSDREQVLEDVSIDQEQEDAAEEQVEIKSSGPNNAILLVTGIIGLVFFFSVFIGATTYIYSIQIKEVKHPEPVQNLKIPGIEGLITDPLPEGPETKIKVWGVGTAEPPESLVFDYSFILNDPESYFDSDELEMYYGIKKTKNKKRNVH